MQESQRDHHSGAKTMHLAYRPDIDGLRALAVLAVVLYHANLGCPGGFVGVDVFFVISGFLITSLITKDLEAGAFRFRDFWERRARRILPALFVMVLAVLVAGWFLLLPGEYETLGKSTVALALFAANIFFWRASNNYFGDNAEENPLLHTWSLAVEEQFYFIVPFLMWGMWNLPLLRGRGKLLSIFIAGFLGSFALSLYGMKHFPGATFYLLPTRAWEMLIGAIVAHLPARSPSTSPQQGRIRMATEMICLLGLAGIIAPIFAYSSRTPFPGFNALAPCLGTGLIIWGNSLSGPTTLVSRVLSLPPLVFIGKISYSLYLWHWPPLVFFTLCSFHPPVGWESGVLVLGSTLCALLSWKFVETPFRKRSPQSGPTIALAYSVAALMLLVTSGTGLITFSGLPSRLSQMNTKYLSAAKDSPFNHEVRIDDIKSDLVPRIGMESTLQNEVVLIWGDSHAMAIVPAVEAILEQRNSGGYVIAHGLTPPVSNWNGGKPGVTQIRTSSEYSSKVIEFVQRQNVSIVIMTGYWTSQTYQRPESTSNITESDGLLQAVKEVLGAGAEPWVMLDVPIPAGDVPKFLFRPYAFFGKGNGICAKVSQTDPYDGFPKEMIQKLEDAGARIINPKPAFLDPTHSYYVVQKDGDILYKDRHHLSGKGAVKMILPVLREAWADYEKRKLSGKIAN